MRNIILQSISFFRKTIGVILDPQPTSGNFFIKITQKAEN